MKSLVAVSVGLLAFVLASEQVCAEPPWLGVIIVDAGGGARITEVITGSPAESGGLRVGDVITQVAGAPTGSATGLITRISSMAVGADVDVDYIRNRKADTAKVTLSARLNESQILARRIVDQTFPPFNLPVVRGSGSGRSEDHLGDVVVLYFFSSACQSCTALHAALSAMDAEDGVQVVAVASALPHSAIKTQAKFVPSGLTVINDSRTSLAIGHLKTLQLPIVVVTDRNRLARYAALGKSIDVDEIRFSVDRALRDAAQ